MVKVTIEANGERNVLEGDFVYGFVGNKDDSGCSITNVMIGTAFSINMPKYLADTAVLTIKNLPPCKKNPIVKYGMLTEFSDRVETSVRKSMAENANELGEAIASFLKSEEA